MRIRLHEVTDHETELRFTEAEPWLARAVAGLDEKHSGDRAKPFEKTGRPIHAELNLRNVDDVIVLNGSVDTQIQLICSRCANYFAFRTHKVFASLFCQDPEMAGVAHLKDGSQKPTGKNHGWARHQHAYDEEDDAAFEAAFGDLDENDTETEDASTTPSKPALELTERKPTPVQSGEAARSDLDITYVAEDEINLEEVILEQLRLLVPFQPLCRKDCHGICTRCGADLNQGRCACSKIVKESPFAALSKLNLPLREAPASQAPAKPAPTPQSKTPSKTTPPKNK